MLNKTTREKKYWIFHIETNLNCCTIFTYVFHTACSILNLHSLEPVPISSRIAYISSCSLYSSFFLKCEHVHHVHTIALYKYYECILSKYSWILSLFISMRDVCCWSRIKRETFFCIVSSATRAYSVFVSRVVGQFRWEYHINWLGPSIPRAVEFNKIHQDITRAILKELRVISTMQRQHFFWSSRCF